MKRIAIIPNYTKDIEYKYTRRLCRYLSPKAELVMQESDRVDGIDAKYTCGDVYDGVDAVIILGGDGTMLQAAEPCGKNAIPVMGINLGKVGFMTEVETDDMETACDRLLADDFCVEDRMMMEITVTGKESEATYLALNDLVISKPDARMVAMELYANNEKVSEYMADGLIISTPTGSTGYSLSAGGPVADPAMNVFIATPICAHTLSARPMLMAEYKNITLRLIENGSENAVVTVDGENKCMIGRSDIVSVRRSMYTLKIIKLGKQSFYYTMMAKL
ncbi:MAG: NAD(+)/NADH kinase [Clostridia bacterium]|nr:NAD(+)/NADH kinase [Clostridia bacterium]